MTEAAVTSRYHLFGLLIQSELPLIELHAAENAGNPDVIIRFGATRSGLFTEPGLHVLENGLLLIVEGVGQFLVSEGREIFIHPDAGTPHVNLRLYVLGSVFGIILQQRCLISLHANAVEIDGHAFAFMGHSGAGKSTLASWFNAQGFHLLADDVCAIKSVAGATPVVLPGLPRLRLWQDALEASGRSSQHYSLSYAGETLWPKYDVPLKGLSARGPTPLAGIYQLSRSDEGAISSVTGVEAFEIIVSNIYRGAYLPLTDPNSSYWQGCLDLVNRVPVFDARRAWGHKVFEAEANRILAHTRSII